MERKLSVPVGGTTFLVQQAYRAGGPYQWARETLVNALQAHATWIEFGVERQFIKGRGVGKRYVADNGIGMVDDQLIEYMSSFGGGGRSIGFNENFGQGQKSSCYPWNTYGMIVLSWTETTPEGRAIWIHEDADGDFTLREFPVEDELGDSYVSEIFIPGWDEDLQIDLSELCFPEIKKTGHGTVFLFLGDSIERDTQHGDFLREENELRGIIGALNRRFIDIPEGVTVRIVALESALEPTEAGRRPSKDQILVLPSGVRKSWHPRICRGLKSFIPDDRESGSVKVSFGTTIDWYLSEDAGVQGDGSYGPSKSSILVEYAATFEGVVVREAYNVTSNLRQYRDFGITSDSVARRVWLVIRPPVYVDGSPEWGVFPQASRGELFGKGSLALPMDKWQEDFYHSFPSEIRQAIDESRSGISDSELGSKLTDKAKQILARLNMRMRPKRIVEQAGGSELGRDSPGRTGESRHGGMRVGSRPNPQLRGTRASLPSGGTGDVHLLHRDSSGGRRGVIRRRGDGLPAVVWDDVETWRNGEGKPEEAARFVALEETDLGDGTRSAGTIHVNLGFQMFTDEFINWINEYPRASSSEVIEVVKEAYALELITKVSHAIVLEGQPTGVMMDSVHEARFTAKYIKECLLTPEALTLSILGLFNVEARIRTIAGGKQFGKIAV